MSTERPPAFFKRSMTRRFLGDATVGRCVQWLRILGFDAAEDRAGHRSDLVERAEREGRLLVTRNAALARGVKQESVLLLESDRFRGQLREIVSRLGIDRGELRPFTRCLRCNALLETLPRDRAEERVPPYVAATQSAFARCASCDRVVWGATHRDRMEAEIGEIFGAKP